MSYDEEEEYERLVAQRIAEREAKKMENGKNSKC